MIVEINGQKVEVDDNLSEEQLHSVIDHISGAKKQDPYPYGDPVGAGGTAAAAGAVGSTILKPVVSRILPPEKVFTPEAPKTPARWQAPAFTPEGMPVDPNVPSDVYHWMVGNPAEGRTGQHSGVPVRGTDTEEADRLAKEYKAKEAARIQFEKDNPGKTLTKSGMEVPKEAVAAERAAEEAAHQKALLQFRIDQNAANRAAEQAAKGPARVGAMEKFGRSLPIAGFNVLANTTDLANRLSNDQNGQALISAAGLAGSAAPFIKALPNVARAAGPVVGAAAPFINMAIDKTGPSAGDVASAATSVLPGPLALGAQLLRPSTAEAATLTKPDEAYQEGMTGLLSGTRLPPQGLAEGGQPEPAKKSIAGALSDVGFVKGPNLTTMAQDYMSQLPEKTRANLAHQMDLLNKSFPGTTYESMMTKGDPKAMAELAMQVPFTALTAFHGTPHNIQGKFDLSKVGTGEGAQVYGHGIYFAQKPGVAREYQKKLSESELRLEGKPLEQQYENLRKEYGDVTGTILQYAHDNGLSDAKNLIQNYTKYPQNAKYFGDPVIDNASLADLLKAKEALNEVESHSLGNLYKVDIPDEHIPKMLDWDKPLSKQKHIWEALPENVRNAIDDKLDQHNMNPVSDALESYKGENLYKFLQDPDIHDLLPAELPGSSWYTGDTTYPKHASAYLNSLGIPGIKYLDQGSRHNIPNVRQVNYYNPDTKEYSTQFQVNPGWNAPNQYKHFPTKEEAEKYADSFGTRNFVSFRPEDVQILERNNEPVGPLSSLE